MRYLPLLCACALLAGCVSGAPTLTDAQREKAVHMAVYRHGNVPPRAFQPLASIDAADCSGAGGTRFHGQEGKAIETLIKKAAALDSDAVVDVACDGAPFVNNCWVAQKCEGTAVRWR